MPVYSKIQQIRDAKRRERQQKRKQKKRKESKELSVSLRGSEKKAKFIKAEAERKANTRERKWRSRSMTKERNELQKLEKENMCRRKTEKQRRNNY